MLAEQGAPWASDGGATPTSSGPGHAASRGGQTTCWQGVGRHPRSAAEGRPIRKANQDHTRPISFGSRPMAPGNCNPFGRATLPARDGLAKAAPVLPSPLTMPLATAMLRAGAGECPTTSKTHATISRTPACEEPAEEREHCIHDEAPAEECEADEEHKVEVEGELEDVVRKVSGCSQNWFSGPPPLEPRAPTPMPQDRCL